MIRKKIFFVALAISITCSNLLAQTVTELQNTAKTFMKQGDYTNAIVILNRCIEKEPSNTSVGKDLALSYFYSQNNVKALETIQPVLESNDADDQCFLIAGNIYKYLEKPKESEKIYKKGIAKFPESGPLYNELGETQIANKDKDAIKNWEKGIKADPSFGRNYFNAARYYFFQKEYIWSNIYGEIFVNMEPNGTRAAEIKKMLLDGYKQMFVENITNKEADTKNEFGYAKETTTNSRVWNYYRNIINAPYSFYYRLVCYR
jgi:tetratricopeptide (TPR) repeat protein